ncbi:MAG: helix-turn-helix domain-containing protein [Rhizobium sp.]|nr:helix-turn-helix domain-containing protein [Rhizobium sp.]
MLTGAQCRAARALTDVTREMLAERAGVDGGTIRDFERKLSEPDDRVRAGLRVALEGFGALFLSDDHGGGRGVRLKFSANEAARIDNLENEGGPAGEDDVAG